MKNPSDMTLSQLTTWLTKTDKSIASFKWNGGTMNSDRGLDLLDRYGDLVDEMKENRYSDWKNYCDKNGSSYSHDQYDMFA